MSLSKDSTTLPKKTAFRETVDAALSRNFLRRRIFGSGNAELVKVSKVCELNSVLYVKDRTSDQERVRICLSTTNRDPSPLYMLTNSQEGNQIALTNLDLKTYLIERITNNRNFDLGNENNVIREINKSGIDVQLSPNLQLYSLLVSDTDTYDKDISSALQTFLLYSTPHTYEQWLPVREALDKKPIFGLNRETLNMLDIVKTIHPEIKGFDWKYRLEGVKNWFLSWGSSSNSSDDVRENATEQSNGGGGVDDPVGGSTRRLLGINDSITASKPVTTLESIIERCEAYKENGNVINHLSYVGSYLNQKFIKSGNDSVFLAMMTANKEITNKCRCSPYQYLIRKDLVGDEKTLADDIKKYLNSQMVTIKENGKEVSRNFMDLLQEKQTSVNGDVKLNNSSSLGASQSGKRPKY